MVRAYSIQTKDKFKNAFNKLTDAQKKAAMDAIRNCDIKIDDICEIGVVSKKNLVDINNKLLMSGICRSIISLKDAAIRQICYIADNESRWPLICSHTSESLASALTKAINERWNVRYPIILFFCLFVASCSSLPRLIIT